MSTQLVFVLTCDQVTQEAGTQDAHNLHMFDRSL